MRGSDLLPPSPVCYTVTNMDLASILLTGLGLSMDCFAVAIVGSLSMQSPSRRQVLRVSFSFGAFQAGMLVIGWLAGRTVVDTIESYDHWIAFALLFAVGAKMVHGALNLGGDERERTDITRGTALLLVSLATSIDALAVGLSLAFLRSKILIAGVVVGGVTFLVTGAGFLLGKKIGAATGRWADVVGGVVLIGIGVRVLLTHVL